MSITTKGGDRGQTSLFSGERVWKDDLRVDAYGTLDELDAHIGDAKHHLDDPYLKELLTDIQNRLYRAMGQLAAKDADFPIPICAADEEYATGLIHSFEEITPLKGFVVPGSTAASAKLDICRTIARRAERRVVALARAESVPPELMGFVNRLSDLFFIIARHVETVLGAITYKTRPENGDCKGE
jgi:ATP:cob(I)alamin adenosyltransferase